MKRARRQQWKPIPGYEGVYSVSLTGQVRRDRGYNCTHAGRILKQGIRGRGYPYVELNRAGVAKKFDVHSLVALAFLGPTPEGKEIRHLDGDSSNPRLSNLAFGTHLENAQDMVKHGRAYAGGEHHAAVLDDEKVLLMQQLFLAGYTSGYLAGRFGVSRTTAWQAASGRTWKHLKGDK